MNATKRLDTEHNRPGRLLRIRQQREWSRPYLARELRQAAQQDGDELPSIDDLVETIRRWEAGLHRPGPRYLELLRRVYGLTALELGLAPITPVEFPLALDEADDEIGTFAAWLDRSSRVTPADVRRLRDHTQVLREQDREGSHQLLDLQLAAHVELLERLLTYSLTPSVRRDLAAALAEVASLRGWQALDSADPRTSWAAYELAERAARAADNPPVLAHVTAERAYVLLDLDHAEQAHTLVGHVVDVHGRKVPPLLHSWLFAVHAEIAAALGRSQECRNSLGKARRYLEGTEADPSLPFIFLDDRHFARWEGSCLARVGDIRAIERIEEARATHDPSFVRAKAALLTDLVNAFMAAGLFDDAAHTLNEAYVVSYETESYRQLRRLRTLKRQLHHHASVA